MDDLADNGSVSVSGRLLADAPMRASDADRHATVLILQDAMARGLLTADEGSDRMATAFAAVHVRDLSPLTADLPADAARRGGPPGWRVLLMMLFEQFSSLFRDNRTGRYKPAADRGCGAVGGPPAGTAAGHVRRRRHRRRAGHREAPVVSVTADRDRRFQTIVCASGDAAPMMGP